MRILVVGTGYVGLVTGACFAQMGHQVICLDVDHDKIENLKKGILPFYEMGLEELVKQGLQSKRIRFSTSYSESVAHAEAIFIAVPTPAQEDGKCDLTYVAKAALSIAEVIDAPKIIAIKSTVPVGTCFAIQKLINALIEKRTLNFSCTVISNPEFLKQGSAVADCLKPDRIILGIDDPGPKEEMIKLYSTFTVKHERILLMSVRSAEMTKYAANAMLASRISFMNEIAGLCEKVGANINDIRQGIGSDKRIGYDFLYAGIGFGGSCFPKDIKALQMLAKEVDVDTPLLDAIEKINIRQKNILRKKIVTYFKDKQDLDKTTIAIWGLSFKPDTDDMREAPSIHLIKELLSLGARVRLYDPASLNNAKKIFSDHPNIVWCESEYDAAEGADGIALVTEWKQFRMVDFNLILKKMQGNAIFDGRNQYKQHEMKEKGFDYFGIGIPHHD